MPKGRHGKGGRGKQVAGKRKEKHGRRAEKREGYIRHGDPEFKSFSEQLAQQGLRLEDVPGDGYVRTTFATLKLSVVAYVDFRTRVTK